MCAWLRKRVVHVSRAKNPRGEWNLSIRGGAVVAGPIAAFVVGRRQRGERRQCLGPLKDALREVRVKPNPLPLRIRKRPRFAPDCGGHSNAADIVKQAGTSHGKHLGRGQSARLCRGGGEFGNTTRMTRQNR